MRVAAAAEGGAVREREAEAPAARGAKRGRGRRRRHEAAEPAAEEGEDELLAEARRRAAAKARIAREVVQYTVVVLALAIFVPIAAWIVAIVWGIGLAKDFGRQVLEPDLRRRWLAREVADAREAPPAAERRAPDGEARRRLEALSAQIAHEIRGPVTAARSLVQQMGEDPGAAENVEHAELALAELDRVERSIAHLLRFARDEALQWESVRMADVIRSAVRTLRDRMEAAGVDLGVRLDTEGRLRGDPEKLRRALVAILENAVDALAAAGVAEPRIEVEAGENLAGSEVWVRVRDNGPGVPEAQRARLFSPFHTTKREGTGLGLALAKKAAEAHGGAVELERGPGGGAAFLLTLPKASEGAEGPP